MKDTFCFWLYRFTVTAFFLLLLKIESLKIQYFKNTAFWNPLPGIIVRKYTYYKKKRMFLFAFFFFFVQFNVPFKIISLISRRANQKVGAKTEYPGKNHLTHPQVELDLSHLWPVWGSNPHQSQRWDDRMVKGDNEISHLNHSATGAAYLHFWGLKLLISVIVFIRWLCL